MLDLVNLLNILEIFYPYYDNYQNSNKYYLNGVYPGLSSMLSFRI